MFFPLPLKLLKSEIWGIRDLFSLIIYIHLQN